ncbi:MAG: ATP synthase F1 subunit epsilon [Verrucomicrobia bacterium GWF2_51_19]|nr:MAG: ATP synthase F1 subunit epsilon [Verrucomicrobia bacterium GWF2_51_19]HCJ11876.1 ATP synthase F1 subunit epsilon [Opitutae bacterium]
MQIKIITPEGLAFESKVETVVLPTDLGETGILPGHIPLTSVLVPGDVQVYKCGGVEHVAVDKGFFRVKGDVISVLTEAAIDVKAIDLGVIAEARAKAEASLEKAQRDPGFDPDELERLEAIIRFNINQQLIKSKLK